MKKTLAGLVIAATLVAPTAATAAPGTVQKQLDGLTRQWEFPGALGTVTTPNGRSAEYVSGTAELGRKVPVPKNGQVRIGSNTKTFVAVVVMQLVAEGKVNLDDPVTKYLPGAIKDDRITVRQLLQHTSGLANYTNHMGLDKFAEQRHRYYEPRELLDIANAQQPEFQPGEKWGYSNTNYVLLGLLIQKVTGRPVAEQVDQRIIQKLKLRDTYWPTVGEQGIRGRHAHGYSRVENAPSPVDVTELDPSWGWAAGQIIGTTKDLNIFFRALVAGELVPQAQLAEMKKTVPAFPGTTYGLGLMSRNLTCGGTYWGHGGDIHGYETRGGVTDNGKAYSVAVTALPGTFHDTEEQAMAAAKAVEDTVDSALCG